MDVKSIAGIAKSRWWVLVLAGVLAVGVTSQLAAYQQDNLITHEAVTSITFVEDPTNLERGDFEQFLSEQHILAEGANRELLGQTPGPFLPWETAEIHLANDQNQLIFIGRGYSQEEANALSVRQELQADCFAGVWAHHAQRARSVLEQGDLEEALAAAAAIGDDRLQRQSQGYVVPESFTHGTSEQRVRWFRRGFDAGETARCDTFQAPAP